MNHSLEELSLVKKIEIDRNHIDNFVLETTEGTKRTKAKFHREASEQRNAYVERQLSFFQECLKEAKNEMAKRVQELIPEDRSNEYTADLLTVDNLLDLVKLNSNISNRLKLKLDFIVSSITEDTSLQNLNVIIDSFIKRMGKLGISLSIKDFQYTMFTQRYMEAFFKQVDFNVMKEVFEKLYFACPDIKLQLKMNLEDILTKYEKELGKYVLSLTKSELEKYHVTSGEVVVKYVSTRQEVGNRIAMDPYYNTMLFLDNKKKITDYVVDAPARNKNYDLFTLGGSYASLEEPEKAHYNSAVMGFYLTLNELKKYYRYEFMVTDLLNRYKEKDSAKTNYLAKKKEIDKEEKVRLSIYKEYLKSMGIGFLAKKNEEKSQSAKLKMNEQIRKLHDLYAELEEMDISYRLASLSESATLYELFLTALQSFPFLAKCFTGNEDFEEKSLEENVQELFRFVYNPHNDFLRKINAFADYNVTDVVAEKYKLLNLNVTNEMINLDNIDSTLESARFVNLVQNVERSTIDFHMIENLYNMKKIVDEGESKG